MESILEYWSVTRVNQDLQATLYIGVSVSNPGYSGLSPNVYTRISGGDKVQMYTKTCQLHCTPKYQSVT